MKKAFAFILLFFVWPLYADVMSINQFSGLNTDESSLVLTEGQTPDSENVVTDEGQGLQGRNGCVAFSTETNVVDMWEFPHSNGTRYLIAHNDSDNELKALSGTETNFATKISTVAASIRTVGTVLGDRFYFANTTDGLKYWDGTSVTVASAALTVDKLVTWKNRLAAAGKSGSERTLFLSEDSDGTSWALQTDPVATDPAQIVVSGALDEVIEALYAPFIDKLIWFKKNSFGALAGSSRNNFIQRTLGGDVGISDPDSVQGCGNYLRWLGPDRTVYEFDGAKYYSISNDIDDELADILQGDAAAKNNEQSSQSDWEAGTASPTDYLDLTTNPGRLIPETTDFNLTNQPDWLNGTLGGTTYFADMWISSGSIQVAFPEVWSDFRNTSNGKLHLWDQLDINNIGNLALEENQLYMSDVFPHTDRFGIHTHVPLYNVLHGTTIMFKLNELEGRGPNVFKMVLNTVKKNDPKTGTYWAWEIKHDDGLCYYFNTVVNSEGDSSLYDSTHYDCDDTVADFSVWLGTNTFTLTFGTNTHTGSHTWANADPFLYLFYKPATETGSHYARLGRVNSVPIRFTHTSAGQDTGMDYPLWNQFNATHEGSPSFTMQVSDSDSSYDADVVLTTGSAPTAGNKRYAKIKTTFNPTLHNSTYPITLKNYDFKAWSTGTFTSQVITVGDDISAWNRATIASSDTASLISYQFNASSSSSIDDFNSSSWTTITHNSIPTNGTNTYCAWRVDFDTGTVRTLPYVDSLSINWTEGSTIRTSSVWFDEMYWLGVAISSTSNNRGYVYDTERQWQRYTGTHGDLDSMGVYNSELYFGNQNKFYLGSTGYSDDGEDITSYFRTKSGALIRNNDPMYLDIPGRFDYIYVTADNSDSTLTNTYRVNGSTTEYNLGSKIMNADSGYQNMKFPFQNTEVQQGKYIDFKFSVTGNDFWRINNVNFYYQPGVHPD